MPCTVAHANKYFTMLHEDLKVLSLGFGHCDLASVIFVILCLMLTLISNL